MNRCHCLDSVLALLVLMDGEFLFVLLSLVLLWVKLLVCWVMLMNWVINGC
jgi:hypothetical protein